MQHSKFVVSTAIAEEYLINVCGNQFSVCANKNTYEINYFEYFSK